MNPIDKFAEVIANHVADDIFRAFNGNVMCEECKKIFPTEEAVLHHPCALKKLKKRGK